MLTLRQPCRCTNRRGFKLSSRRSKIVGQEAFRAAFAETEVVMRLALGKLIQTEIDKETNADIIKGLEIAKKIVAGESNES